MFGFNKLKLENKNLRERNEFLKLNINHIIGESNKIEVSLKEEISRLENLIRKKDEELSIQYEFKRLREKNSDTEKFY